MKIIFTISILLLGLISVQSQGFQHSPGYYPLPIEQAATCKPVNLNSFKPANMDPGPKNWAQKHNKGLYVTAIQLASVVLDATGDAVYDMGKEGHNSRQMFWGHTMQATALAGAASSVIMLSWQGNFWDGIKFGVGYTAMRYAAFDLTYNVTRGIDPLYADGVKAKMPPAGRVITQGIAFVFSVSWNIIEF